MQLQSKYNLNLSSYSLPLNHSSDTKQLTNELMKTLFRTYTWLCFTAFNQVTQPLVLQSSEWYKNLTWPCFKALVKWHKTLLLQSFEWYTTLTIKTYSKSLITMILALITVVKTIQPLVDLLSKSWFSQQPSCWIYMQLFLQLGLPRKARVN